MKFENLLSSYAIYQKDKKQSHVAFLVNGKKLVAVGENQYGRYSYKGNRISSLHAEIDCIRQLKGLQAY